MCCNCCSVLCCCCIFFFKQKTAYEMRISDWSSDVCSSDLRCVEWEWPRIRIEILVERDSQKGIVIGKGGSVLKQVGIKVREQLPEGAIGRASCRERVCQYV